MSALVRKERERDRERAILAKRLTKYCSRLDRGDNGSRSGGGAARIRRRGRSRHLSASERRRVSTEGECEGRAKGDGEGERVSTEGRCGRTPKKLLFFCPNFRPHTIIHFFLTEIFVLASLHPFPFLCSCCCWQSSVCFLDRKNARGSQASAYTCPYGFEYGHKTTNPRWQTQERNPSAGC